MVEYLYSSSKYIKVTNCLHRPILVSLLSIVFWGKFLRVYAKRWRYKRLCKIIWSKTKRSRKTWFIPGILCFQGNYQQTFSLLWLHATQKDNALIKVAEMKLQYCLASNFNPSLNDLMQPAGTIMKTRYQTKIRKLS